MMLVRTAPRKQQRPDWPTVLLGGALRAAAMFFLDPNRGHRRRIVTRDRSLAAARHGLFVVRRTVRWTVAGAFGLWHRVFHTRPPSRHAADDVTLAHRVESELFRDPHIPKGQINVDAHLGVVVLRGQLDRPEQIRTVEALVKRIPDVRRVESYLHLPNTPAPNKWDALAAG